METVKQYVTILTVTVFAGAFILGYGASALVYRSRVSGNSRTAPTVAQDAVEASAGLADLSAKESSAAAPANSISANGGQAADNSVAAQDQAPGSSAVVSATLAHGAWITIRDDADGKPGKILGARYFVAGSSDGTVELLRPMEAGRKYDAVIQTDDGDMQFDYAKDMPLTDSAGKLVMHAFMTFEAPAK